jgi:hypothetical protein
MVRISLIWVTLLMVCVTLPALAQAPPANTISCSSGSACKKGSIPVFTSNGGAAKVGDSIISESASTVIVAGSETATQNISAGGNVSASGNVSGGTISTTGNISGATVSATGNISGGAVSASGNVSATQLVSTVAQGTAPLQVTSTTQVSNLNASLLGGSAASSFQPAGSYAVLGTNLIFGYQTVATNGGQATLMTIPNLGTVLVDCDSSLSRIAFFPSVSGSLWFVNGGSTGFASGTAGTQLSNQSTDDLITAQFATTTQNATMVISGHPASTCIYSGQATVQGPGLHDAKVYRGRRSH